MYPWQVNFINDDIHNSKGKDGEKRQPYFLISLNELSYYQSYGKDNWGTEEIFDIKSDPVWQV